MDQSNAVTLKKKKLFEVQKYYFYKGRVHRNKNSIFVKSLYIILNNLYRLKVKVFLSGSFGSAS